MSNDLAVAISVFESIERRCPNRDAHTPIPNDIPYLQWVKGMTETYRRTTCQQCGLAVIWRRRLARNRLDSGSK